ncbi:hypothetical protein C1646_772349 [Rhizophagus diaphanus]|nr:hypothetical protein C1646_772349 [Rhizophagus diaphanus] [Rhizophagus sp. MUCL 43196]
MPNVHTLRDIMNRRTIEGLLSKHIPPGHRLGSIHKSELEKALRGSIKTASDIANNYKDLQDIYLEQVKDFNRICSDFNNKFKSVLTLTQKASSANKVQILSLETKICELEGKLKDIDLKHTYYDLDVMGEVIEKPVEMPKLPDWLHDNLKSVAKSNIRKKPPPSRCQYSPRKGIIRKRFPSS